MKDAFNLALFERDLIAAGLPWRQPRKSKNGLTAFTPRFLDRRSCSREGRLGRCPSRLYCRARGGAAACRAEPDGGPLLSVLGVIDAGLGRKEEAMREGRRAVELMPVAKDSLTVRSLYPTWR